MRQPASKRDQQAVRFWEGEPQAVRETRIPSPGSQVMAFLQEHGCVLVETDVCVHITFPEGSTRTEIYPRCMDARFRLCLPDGTQLHEVQPRFADPTRRSLLYPMQPMCQDNHQDPQA
jgi:hypothetical protein